MLFSVFSVSWTALFVFVFHSKLKILKPFRNIYAIFILLHWYQSWPKILKQIFQHACFKHLLVHFRGSQEHLQEEKDKLHTRCRELEAALEQAHEQLGSQIQEQQQVTLYWKERWQQTAVNMKNVEELLEQEKFQCQKASEKVWECSGKVCYDINLTKIVLPLFFFFLIS